MILRYTIPMKNLGTTNRLYARHAGGVHKTAEARAFAGVCAAYGQQARRRAGWGTLECRVDVALLVVFDSERPDIDAPEKIVLDSLQVSDAKKKRIGAGFVLDDRQAQAKLTLRRVEPGRPRVEVVLAPEGELVTLGIIEAVFGKAAA